jgi:hypothetical protein
MANALRSPARNLVWLAWFQGAGAYYQDFGKSDGGWTANNATFLADGEGYLLTSTATGPQMVVSGLDINGSANRYVLIDLEHVSGSGTWDGKVFYTTGGHGESASYYATFSELASGRRRIAVDMHALAAGGTDWATSDITGIRLDFSQSSGVAYRVRSVRVGSNSDLFAWSGMHSIAWAAADWLGVGNLYEIAAIDRGDALAWRGLQFSLNGLDGEALAGLDESVKGRAARLWLGALNDAGQIVRDPLLVAELQQDTLQREINPGDGTVKLMLNTFDAAARFDRPTGKKWSPESQKAVYPTDEGFYYTGQNARKGPPIDWRPG